MVVNCSSSSSTDVTLRQDEYGGYSSQVGTLDDIKFADEDGDEDGDEEDDGQDRRNGNLK